MVVKGSYLSDCLLSFAHSGVLISTLEIFDVQLIQAATRQIQASPQNECLHYAVAKDA